MSKAKKGGIYEREISKSLSLWLSSDRENPSDDHLWRSSTSGARATVRARKGKSTSNNESDLSGTTKLGRKFLSIFAVEIKCGYNNALNATVSDILDSKPKRKVQTLLSWIDQVQQVQLRTKTPHWLIIHKRDRREAVVYCDVSTFIILADVYVKDDAHFSFVGGLCRLNKRKYIGVFKLKSLLNSDVKVFKQNFF